MNVNRDKPDANLVIRFREFGQNSFQVFFSNTLLQTALEMQGMIPSPPSLTNKCVLPTGTNWRRQASGNAQHGKPVKPRLSFLPLKNQEK